MHADHQHELKENLQLQLQLHDMDKIIIFISPHFFIPYSYKKDRPH
jgi:hypothetical protein